MITKTEWRARAVPRAAAVAAAVLLLLAGCGGGSKDEAGEPWLDQTQAATGDRARIAARQSRSPAWEQRTTLAQYAIDRQQWVTVLGFAAPTEDELAFMHGRSVARGIAQLLPQLQGGANGLALPALEASLMDTLAAAARGDTLAELRQHHPAAPGYYASTVETQPVDRSAWAPAGTPLLAAFLREIDLVEPLPPLRSWEGAEVTSRDDRRLAAALDGFSTEAIDALSLGADTRLLVIDRLRDGFGFASDPKPLADGVFAGADGMPRLMPMLQLPAIRHQGDGYLAHLASTPSYRHIVTIQPGTQDLQAFAASGGLATAIAELAQMTRQRTLVALPAGTMVLPVVDDLALPGNTVPAVGLSLATSEVNADLRGLDGGGSYLRLAQLPSRLSISAQRMLASGGHAAAFHYSPLNLHGSRGAGFTAADPAWPVTIGSEPRACPRSEPDLRSFFIAVFDDDLRLVSLAALGRLPGEPCQ